MVKLKYSETDWFLHAFFPDLCGVPKDATEPSRGGVCVSLESTRDAARRRIIRELLVIQEKFPYIEIFTVRESTGWGFGPIGNQPERLARTAELWLPIPTD
jgi:hypothetical protein